MTFRSPLQTFYFVGRAERELTSIPLDFRIWFCR